MMRVPGFSLVHRTERKARGKGRHPATRTGATPYPSARVSGIPVHRRRAPVKTTLIALALTILVGAWHDQPDPLNPTNMPTETTTKGTNP